MYANPTLFAPVSNRETWLQIVQISDDASGDLISLTDGNGQSLYAITLEIMRAEPRGHASGYGSFTYYDCDGDPSIHATLADYIAIVDTGTIQIQIPKSVMHKLRAKSYDVFMTIDPIGDDDGRQLLIGRLPVLYGGRAT